MADDAVTSEGWYHARDGRQAGPLGELALRQLAASGELRAGDLVWTHGMPNWSPAGQVPALRDAFAQAPASPPPLPPPRQQQPYAPGGMPLGYAGPLPAPGQPGGPPGIGDDAGMRWLLPVGRSGWAIAAGYLGLFSFLLFPAPIALILSLIAIRDMRRNPHRHGMGRAIFGLVMGVAGTALLTLMIVRLAVLR